MPAFAADVAEDEVVVVGALGDAAAEARDIVGAASSYH